MTIYRLLFGLVLLGGISFSQTHTFPALDTNNTFTGNNTFSGTTTIYSENGTQHCEKFATPGATFDVIMAACIAALPANGPGVADATNLGSAGVLGVDSSALTMGGNWSMSRSGTGAFFGCYTVQQGTNLVQVPSPTSNIFYKGCPGAPWGTTPAGLTNGTIFRYTGTGQAHSFGDSSATSFGHVIEDIAFDMTGAGAGAIALTSTRVYGTELNRLRGLCTTSANTVTWIKLDGTSTAPGGQTVNIREPIENNCNVGTLVTGGSSPPLENNIHWWGGQYSGGQSGGVPLSGQIAVDVEVGNDIEFNNLYIGSYDTGLKVNSPTVRAVWGTVHVDVPCGTQAVNFTASAIDNWIWLDSGCPITDTGGATNQNTIINPGTTPGLSTTLFLPGSITALSTTRPNTFYGTVQTKGCGGLPATTNDGTLYFCGAPGVGVFGRFYLSSNSGGNKIDFAKRSATVDTVTQEFYDTGTVNFLGGLKLGGTGSNTVAGLSTPSITTQNLLISNQNPTIAAGGCGGSAASIPASNGPSAFTINVGTAPTAGGCTVTLPAAASSWACQANDITTVSTNVFVIKQTAGTTTSVTLVNYSDVAVATAPTASDIWRVSCFAY